MSNSCNKCARVISDKDRPNSILCSECKTHFHSFCLNISDLEIKVIDRKVWKCPSCIIGVQPYISKGACSNPSNGDLMEKLLEIEAYHKNTEQQINASLNLCHIKLDENAQELVKISHRIDKNVENIQDVITKNIHLEREVGALKMQLDSVDQYNRRNTIEIHGIPCLKHEDVRDLILQVGNALGVTIERNCIDACHRLGLQKLHHPPPGIICKFLQRHLKEEMIHRRKVKRNLTTLDIGMTSGAPIYINESLTPFRRQLLAKARAFKKVENYKFLWTRNGNIYMRRNESASILELKSDDDINAIRNSINVSE
ncbi:hypothetical protein RI129_008961 [Pyrocoelia pectoralis]|uniref:PHD-type domain-containing protein n=1 Tax=Pyrocoelia pectoralis TaxID=417401 RepID=A0AAN7VF39_9COLE